MPVKKDANNLVIQYGFDQKDGWGTVNSWETSNTCMITANPVQATHFQLGNILKMDLGTGEIKLLEGYNPKEAVVEFLTYVTWEYKSFLRWKQTCEDLRKGS